MVVGGDRPTRLFVRCRDVLIGSLGLGYLPLRAVAHTWSRVSESCPPIVSQAGAYSAR